MKKVIFFLLIYSITSLSIAQNLQTPDQKLRYALGDKFTFHHQVVDYFKYLADNSDQIILKKYGETYEGRPLYYAVISSSENIANLDEIQNQNVAQTGLNGELNGAAEKAVVWLSYNIHGNEASSTEASMKTAYELLTGGMESEEWLENTIIIMDPCVNPDGRDRYANFYRRYGAKNFNPNLDAVEHDEPWPGGRPNHYLFDLNRDWAWQTQTESKARMKAYHEWMPHIHVDFHEQSINSPYYFAPAAEPLHEVITDWQKDFQTQIGQNHAKYFDQNNWLYFTRERFDLFYPSYGDTYPTFNGAIGMTYEQAGNGRAGLGAITNIGDTLTLKDRLEHHYTTGMSTIEIASQNAEKLNSEFKKYFSRNINNPEDPFKSYVIKWTEDKKDDIKALLEFLEGQKIEIGQIGKQQNLSGYSYFQRKEISFNSDKKDLVISAYQPKSTLIQALFDPKPNYSDSLTYDITAWAIPYAYGLETYGLKNRMNSEPIDEQINENDNLQSAYAYAIKWNSFNSAQFLAEALKQDIKVRIAYKNLKFKSEEFNKGSLIITQTNNEEIKNLNEELLKLSNKFEIRVYPITSGFADKIYDIGSSEVQFLKAPRIAVLMDEGVSSLAYGEIWYFFEQSLDYPIHSIRVSSFDRIDISDYDQLILPSGSYSNLTEEGKSKLLEFAKSGGKVIAMGSAISLIADHENGQLKTKKEDPSEEALALYENAERKRLSSSIFGAIYDIQLDNSHPLAFGLGNQYFSLKTSGKAYEYLPNGWNVGVIKSNNSHIAGFAGYKAKQQQLNSMVFGVESFGRGQVIYLQDDPLFRAFWHQGQLLFANALFMVGND
ncbi:M14 family metallopeptidase [Marivirga salinae]|uniref:M14 family metallopeptidase n=1 Tax=Marivirga salinarum TaxID=3059078 RepID=A0AA51NBE5_9BACT|nr:M14 family metallopeptidase [Marivirga sp. BDSF4-3]WMN11904.1 M14 family metallopeptidase [Marivirga sp. BDSF4-3]